MSDSLVDWVEAFSWETALIIAAGDGQEVMPFVVRCLQARAVLQPAKVQSPRMRASLFSSRQEWSELMHVDATMHQVEPWCTGFTMGLEEAAGHWYGSNCDLLLVAQDDRTRLDATVARWLPNLTRDARIYIVRPQGLGKVPEIERGVLALARSASARLVLLADEPGGWLLGRSVVTERRPAPPPVGE